MNWLTVLLLAIVSVIAGLTVAVILHQGPLAQVSVTIPPDLAATAKSATQDFSDSSSAAFNQWGAAGKSMKWKDSVELGMLVALSVVIVFVMLTVRKGSLKDSMILSGLYRLRKRNGKNGVAKPKRSRSKAKRSKAKHVSVWDKLRAWVSVASFLGLTFQTLWRGVLSIILLLGLLTIK